MVQWFYALMFPSLARMGGHLLTLQNIFVCYTQSWGNCPPIFENVSLFFSFMFLCNWKGKDTWLFLYPTTLVKYWWSLTLNLESQKPAYCLPEHLPNQNGDYEPMVPVSPRLNSMAFALQWHFCHSYYPIKAIWGHLVPCIFYLFLKKFDMVGSGRNHLQCEQQLNFPHLLQLPAVCWSLTICLVGLLVWWGLSPVRVTSPDCVTVKYRKGLWKVLDSCHTQRHWNKPYRTTEECSQLVQRHKKVTPGVIKWLQVPILYLAWHVTD